MMKLDIEVSILEELFELPKHIEKIEAISGALFSISIHSSPDQLLKHVSDVLKEESQKIYLLMASLASKIDAYVSDDQA